ncbi:hypothetical protein CR513_03066, partial [Mucuna pruriens]
MRDSRLKVTWLEEHFGDTYNNVANIIGDQLPIELYVSFYKSNDDIISSLCAPRSINEIMECFRQSNTMTFDEITSLTQP